MSFDTRRVLGTWIFLSEEELPQNSDAVLVLGQYRAALDSFQKRNKESVAYTMTWITKEWMEAREEEDAQSESTDEGAEGDGDDDEDEDSDDDEDEDGDDDEDEKKTMTPPNTALTTDGRFRPPLNARSLSGPMEPSLYSADVVETLGAADRATRLATLQLELVSRMAGVSTVEQFFVRSHELVDELRLLGHDLWSFDSDGEEFETWCGDYTRGTHGAPMVVTFRSPDHH